MTNATVAQPVQFTKSDLHHVANAAQAAVEGDKPMLRAIERALVNLSKGLFSYDGHQVILHSATDESTYHINCSEPMRCNCKGRARGYKCWHIVAARLIVRAAEYHAAQAVATDVVWHFNPATTLVDLVSNGTILETVPLRQAADRLHQLRHAA